MLMATSLLAFSACSEDDSTSTGGGNTSVAVTEVTANPAIINVVASDESEAITVTVKPDDASDKSYTMVSDNESIATIDPATRKVTGVASGSTTITITSNADDTKKTTVTVNVSDMEIAITGLTLSYPFDRLTVGGKLSPSIEYTPDTTTQQGVTYAVDNATATIDADGVVTAVSAGIVKVTATSTVNNAITSEFSITITDPNIADPRCATPPSAGFEEVAGVWEIYNATGLSAFSTEVESGNLNVDAKLICDITLSGNWTPIGAYRNAYSGSFDGNNKTISGLTTNDNTIHSQGLFGQIDDTGIVKNLVIHEPSIVGSNFVGALAGLNRGAIENISVIGGTVTGTGDSVGGIAGSNSGTIIASYNTSTVSGANNVGGIAGLNTGTIIASYNTGDVSGTGANVGGIYGTSSGTNAKATYYLKTASINDGIFGIGGTASDTAGVAEAVDSIATLNTKVDAMNTAIGQYERDNSVTVGVRFVAGSLSTELPTLQAQP